MTRATSFLLANGSAGGARSPANRPGPQPGFARLTVRARGGPVTVTLPRRDYRFRPAGKTYYLAPDGADGADGSKAHPWRSFDRALPALKPGDLLYARGGSYPTPFTIRSSGLPGRPLIISAYPGEQARITQPPGWQREHVHSATVTFQQAKYVWLQGFTIEGCLGTPQAPPGDTYGQNGITLSGSAGEGVRILNNFVSRAQHCGIKEMGHGGRRFVIEGNVVFDNGRTERDHGLYIPSDEAILRGNAVFRNSGFGIHLYHAPRHCQVYDNLCFENGAAGIIVAGSDNLIAHNVCTRNRACGLLLFRGGCTGNVIVDSLLFDNRQGQIAMDNGGGQLGTPTGNRVDFNLLFPPQDAVALPSFAASVGPHGVRADPQVLDAAANDFRLRPTSPARRAAQPLRQIHTAGSPDIGLFPATQYPSPRWTWAGPARRGWLSELPAGTTSR